jgi:hypothetical protein
MSSHIHLALLAGQTEMWRWTKRVNSPFARWLNSLHHRLGSVFADRAKAHAVLPEHERDLIAYIHNNPVRAGVVRRAAESTWTSHRAYVGLVRSPGWLRVSDGLRRGGFDDPNTFDTWVDVTSRDENVQPAIAGIHPAARKRGFIELATPIVGARTVVPLVARSFARVRPDPRRLISLVAALFGVPETLVCSRRNVPVAVRARRATVHAARALGIGGSDIAAAIGISPQAASKLSLQPLDPEGLRIAGTAADQIADELTARGEKVETVP